MSRLVYLWASKKAIIFLDLEKGHFEAFFNLLELFLMALKKADLQSSKIFKTLLPEVAPFEPSFRKEKQLTFFRRNVLQGRPVPSSSIPRPLPW